MKCTSCLSSLGLVIALSACGAETPQNNLPINADINVFASLVENTFVTPPENTDTIIKDRRVRVYSDALDGIWFYTQLNTGADGKLYRQRLSNLTLSDDGSAIVQRTYGLKDPSLYENAWEFPERLKALTEADFKPYLTSGCEQIWKPTQTSAWSGYVDPMTCVITSKRRNKDIRIESEGYLSKDEYRTNERGYDMDMTFLWGSKSGEMITLYPVR